jgi:hypothetical protein
MSYPVPPRVLPAHVVIGRVIILFVALYLGAVMIASIAAAAQVPKVLYTCGGIGTVHPDGRVGCAELPIP